MKFRHVLLTVLMIAGFFCVAACGSGADKRLPLRGTNDTWYCEPVLPEALLKELGAPIIDGRNYECILDDKVNGVEVWNLMLVPGTDEPAYSGVVIRNNGIATGLPYVLHGYCSSARYDPESSVLWYTGTSSSGTGIHEEELYLIEFNDAGTAYVTCHIEPIPIQDKFLENLSYSVRDSIITVWKADERLFEANALVEDMGGYDENAVWIGEQIRYDISGKRPVAILSPGVKFITGLVLSYEGMPDLCSELDIEKGTSSFGLVEIRVIK